MQFLYRNLFKYFFVVLVRFDHIFELTVIFELKEVTFNGLLIVKFILILAYCLSVTINDEKESKVMSQFILLKKNVI